MVEFRTLPLAELRPAPYNPRVPLEPGLPGYERLARSLSEFDLVQPIVWNEQTGHIVSGHQRARILEHRGVTELQVAVVSLSLEREKALNVALNNARVGGDWDYERLGELLTELNAASSEVFELTGFDEQELHHLLLSPVEELLEEDLPTPDERVRVELLVPACDWNRVRPALDKLIARFKLESHVHLPRDPETV